MNTAWYQTVADLWTKPNSLSHRLSYRGSQ